MSHFPHFSSAGAEYSSPARERWLEIATTESCRDDTITSCAFGFACFSRKHLAGVQPGCPISRRFCEKWEIGRSLPTRDKLRKRTPGGGRPASLATLPV